MAAGDHDPGAFLKVEQGKIYQRRMADPEINNLHPGFNQTLNELIAHIR